MGSVPGSRERRPQARRAGLKDEPGPPRSYLTGGDADGRVKADFPAHEDNAS